MFSCNEMAAIPVKVLVSVCWFSVYCGVDGVVGSWGDLGVQKWNGAIRAWFFHCELYVWYCVLPYGWPGCHLQTLAKGGGEGCCYWLLPQTLVSNEGTNMGNPWLHHGSVHNTYLERESKCFWDRTPVRWLFVGLTFVSFVVVWSPVIVLVEQCL